MHEGVAPVARSRPARAPTDPAPHRCTPPGAAAGAGPQARRDRDGRQRPLGPGAGPAAHGRSRPGRELAVRRGRGSHRDRGQGDLGVRLLDRELVTVPRRGQVPHGLQPRRDPPPARRDARPRGPGALGGARAAAVALGDQGAPGRRGADPRQRGAHVDHVRQLRRARRAGRRGQVPGPGRRGRSGQPRPGGREGARPLPLRPRAARRGPGVAHLGGAAAVELHALAGGVLRAGVQRRAVARRGPSSPVGGDRHLRASGPALRRRGTGSPDRS